MKVMELSMRDRQRIQETMSYGDVGRISKIAKCSRVSVYRFFSGQNSNIEIIEAIVQLIEARKSLNAKLAQYLNKA